MASPATVRRQSSIKLSPVSRPSLWESPRRRSRAKQQRLSAPTLDIHDLPSKINNDDTEKREESPNRGAESPSFADLIHEGSSPPASMSSAAPLALFRLDPRLSSHRKQQSQFDSTLQPVDESPTLENSSRQLFSSFDSARETYDSAPPSLVPQTKLRRSPRKAKPPINPITERTQEAKVNSPPSSPQKKSPVLSLLYPPPTIRANDFTLTPTVPSSNLMDNNIQHYQRQNQHYHRSPHWSGQVRINPFSPVPEKYLNPPGSTAKSSTASSAGGGAGGGRKRSSSFYNSLQLGPPSLPTESSQFSEKKKSRRTLKPKNSVTFLTSLQPRSDSKRAAKAAHLEESRADRISPTDVVQATLRGGDLGECDDSPDVSCRIKRKNPPQSAALTGDWQEPNKRIRLKRGRYLEDFEEVSFLGSGSFGSVNACLSRLDGCMYAIKSICPNGNQNTANNNTTLGYNGGNDDTSNLYGGLQRKRNSSAVPPTPRRDMPPSPVRRRKPARRFSGCNDMKERDSAFTDGTSVGSSHWSDSSLRRMLREVFALAALCNQADVRTFHIVRYFQAWLEDDGTLYIQTELCSATLRDEMTGNVVDGERIVNYAKKEDRSAIPGQQIDVHRQFKLLREVLLALELIHEQGMVHLDIKPENIFVKDNLYKLGDFGLVHGFSKSEGSEKISSISDIEEGDSRYMPKDLLSDDHRDLTKCDIFSLGATMYELCIGRPLPGCGQEWQDLRNGKLSPLPGIISPCLYSIIREMMHPDPEKRPGATNLLSRQELSGDDGNFFLHGIKTSSKLRHSGANSKPQLKRSSSWIL